MDRPAPPHPPASSISSTSTDKVERRIVEKNRRNHMKILFSQLNSLLPNPPSKVRPASTLSDQIDEAIDYIKSLKMKLKMYNEKKDDLLGKKRLSTMSADVETSSNSPQIKIREMGSALEVVLTTGLDEQFIFYEIINIFNEERAEIISASYSVIRKTVFSTLHAEIEDIMNEFGATKIKERLKRLVLDRLSDAKLQPAAADKAI